MKNFFVVLFSLIFLLSCKKEEKLIDNIKDNWYLLVATSGTESGLKPVFMPDGVIQNDVYFANNGKYLPANVEKIAEFRGYLYLFMPSVYKIEVISKSTFKHIATLDFSSGGKVPSDICFPNATDAYICHGNDTTVSLVDITDSTKFIVARTITVGKNPVAITSSGNQIFVANQKDNTVSLIDSRTHKVESTINVAPVPTFLDVSSDGKKVVLVSIGDGKLQTGNKTSAVVTIIDALTHTISTTKDLNTSTSNATDLQPTGLAVSNYDLAFIPSFQNLLTYDVIAGVSINLIEEIPYLKTVYNAKRDEFILLRVDNNTYYVKVLDASSYGQKAEVSFSITVNCVHPL